MDQMIYIDSKCFHDTHEQIDGIRGSGEVFLPIRDRRTLKKGGFDDGHHGQLLLKEGREIVQRILFPGPDVHIHVSDMEGWAQYGHNRDVETLKQINYALVTDREGIPVMFRMLPDSIADICIMQQTVNDMKEIGCQGRLVRGREFESARNISALIDMDVDFTIPSNAKAESVNKLMTMSVKELTSSSSFTFHNGATYKYAEYEAEIIDTDDGNSEYVVHVPQNHKDSAKNNKSLSKSKKLKAFIVYDPRKAALDIDAVMSMVNDVELRLENAGHNDPEMTYAKLPAFVHKFWISRWTNTDSCT